MAIAPPAAGRPAVRSLAVSLIGSLLPAGVGALATLVAYRSGSGEVLVPLLLVWTLNGYLTLSDFGLTRVASRLVSQGQSARATVVSMRRTAMTVGLGMSGVAMVGLWVATLVVPQSVPPVLWFMAPLPLVTALTFPTLGAMEGAGRYSLVAGHRLANAVSVYLVPALLVSLGESGLALGIAVLWGYRILAVLVLPLLLPQVDAGQEHPDAAMQTGAEIRGMVAWMGLSSLLGPLFLYLDRAFVPAGAGAAVWIFYVSLSELLLRSYVVPASVLAVVFPWTVRRLATEPASVRRLYAVRLPIVTGVGAGLAVTTVLALPDAALRSAGVALSDVLTARLTVLVLVAGTVVNWANQAQVALGHALGRGRAVAGYQAALLVPYAAALFWAGSVGVLMVAVVWGVRILLLAVLLWVDGTRQVGLLSSGPGGRHRGPIGATPATPARGSPRVATSHAEPATSTPVSLPVVRPLPRLGVLPWICRTFSI